MPAQPTSASDIQQARWDICRLDQQVKGQTAAASAGITSATSDEVLRRWEMRKWVDLLPTEALQRACGLSDASHHHRSAHHMATFLLAKAHALTRVPQSI